MNFNGEELMLMILYNPGTRLGLILSRFLFWGAPHIQGLYGKNMFQLQFSLLH